MLRVLLKVNFIVSFAILVGACSPVAKQTSGTENSLGTEIIQLTNTEIVSVSPEETLQPTSAVSSPSANDGTPTEQPDHSRFATECFSEEFQKSNMDPKLENTLIFYDSEKLSFVAASGTPLEISKLPFEKSDLVDWVGFSLDGTWLAYAEGAPTIDLFSSGGRVVEISMSPEEILQFVPEGSTLGGWGNHEWINDELILLTIAYREADNNLTNEQKIMILDPINGAWKNNLLTELPSRYEYSGATFSPDLSRVLYVEDTGQHNLVLWNRDDKSIIQIDSKFFDKNLLAFEGNRLATIYTEWSPDSSKIVFAGQENLDASQPAVSQVGIYISDRDGTSVKRLSDFSSKFDTYHAYGYRWSPDNQFIAFGLFQTKENISDHVLYILDVENGDIKFTCSLM